RFSRPARPRAPPPRPPSSSALPWPARPPRPPRPAPAVPRRPDPPRPGPAVAPEVTAAFTRQAEQDLVRFLECRARELVPGGKLLLAGPGDTDQASVCDGLCDILNDACLDLVAAGRLARGQYERLTIPVYFRTLDELLAPLEREGSPVRGAFAVDRAGTMDTPAPFVVEFRRGGDLAAYAGAYTGFLRAVTEPVIRAALDQPEGKDETVDCLYERIRTRLTAEPKRYTWRYALVAALLTRR